MAAVGRFNKDTKFSKDAQKLADTKKGNNELWIDIQRRRLIAQEYLTYVGEAKEWIEECLGEELPSIVQLEEQLRDGVILAKLARFYAPDIVKKIYDEKRELPLNLRHSDNYNAYVRAATQVGFPRTFNFELTDLYDRKNMPKVIYGVHVLSHYLTRLGLAPKMKKRRYQFTDEELAAASENLGDLQLPKFGDIASQFDGKPATYESKAQNLSQWIEESTAMLEDKDYLNASHREIEDLQRDLVHFRQVEKPPKAKELQELKKMSKSESELPEWLEIEKLQEKWEKMEMAEEKRKESLILGMELADLEKDSQNICKWLNNNTVEFNKRNYENATPSELMVLLEKIKVFRETDKVEKMEKTQSWKKLLNSFEEKCKPVNPALAVCARNIREGLERLWMELEDSESRREEDLLFRIKMIDMKKEYLVGADFFIKWAIAQTAEFNERDFDTHTVNQLTVLISNLKEYQADEKPPRFKEYTGLVSTYSEISSLLHEHCYPEFEPKNDLGINEVKGAWNKVETAEKEREYALNTVFNLRCKQDEYLYKSKIHVAWLHETIENTNSRNFPDTAAACTKLAGQEEDFKKNEIFSKAQERDGLYVQHQSIIEIIDEEDYPEFEVPSEQTPQVIAELWTKLQSALTERASALANEQIKLGDEERAKLLQDNEDFWVKIQAIARGRAQRKKIQDMKDHYQQHEDDIIKVQSVWRAKIAGKHYRALKKDNPPIETIQNFLHLLDDSDKDFEEEIELEKLKHQVVVQIRDNAEREKNINVLDIKIALLIKNRTTLDDVVESSKKYNKKQRRESENFDHGLKTLEKDTRKKLELYQNLFYLLQTEPRYLAGLIFQLKKKEKVQKFIETTVLTLYGYAQNEREEYLLLKLFKDTIAMEINQVTDPHELLLGNPTFIKLVLQYIRGPKESQFLRESLQPLIQSILDESDFDLEVDPLSIYRGMIKDEESQTGEKSHLAYDVSRSQALENDKVMKIFVKRLKDLRAVTEKFVSAIMSTLAKFPYGLRYICSEIKGNLMAKFPDDEERILRIVGNVVYYRYMNPAIVAPEAFGIIENQISPLQRKNLAEVSKMLHQISTNKHFGEEFFYLSALNEFITKCNQKFLAFFDQVSNAMSPEEYFKIDEYDDFSRTAKPIVYISQEEIYSTHALLLEHLDGIAPTKNDPLRTILSSLGAPPEGSAENTTRGAEMALTLTNKFENIQADDAQLKTLYVQTKRYILSIISVQQGEDLLDILESSSTLNEEKIFSIQREREKTRNEQRNSVLAISELGLDELKRKTLQNLEELEKHGLVSKESNYQEMLNAIAKDIKHKNRRRIQRRSELEKVKNTLNNLATKTAYLDGQIASYNEYVQACIHAMSDNKGSKKTKKKPTMLFSSQYFHEQKLKKLGKEYQFGSFKYTADKLFEKGVLVELDGVSPSQRHKVSFTISSDEVGVFEVQGKFMGVKVENVELRLDDLLQKQFENVQVISLFDTAKVNVNLLLYLLNKRFYV